MLLSFDTIERSVDFDERASAMRLRPWQWEFLLAADGRTRLGDLARLCGLDFETAAELVRETESLGLVEIVTLTLEGYRAAAAHLVTPLAAPEAPVAFAAPVEGAPEIADEPPVALAAPRKSVSVSFDSFSTMLDSWETEEPSAPTAAQALEVAPYAPAPVDHEIIFDDSMFSPEPLGEAPEPKHDFPDSPLLENVPIDFELPDHMTPLADRPTATKITFSSSDSYADLFAEPQPGNGNGAHHDHLAFSSDALEPLAFEASPLMETAHADFAHPEGELARDPFAPLQPFDEPGPAPKKGVSFSLSADSFGLPSIPLDQTTLESPASDGHASNGFASGTAFETTYEPAHESTYESTYEPASEHAFEGTSETEPVAATREDFARELRAAHAADAPAPAAAERLAPEPAPPAKQDDVLLGHFHTPTMPEETSAEGRNGDLAGTLLRVLGLKK